MSYLPGGTLAYRPLHFYWICDCSGSMSINGKIDALNSSIKTVIPEMRKIAYENPNSRIFLSAIRFSHEANWVTPEPVELNSYAWKDLKADELEKPQVDVVFLLDTSGSMGDEIDAVKASCKAFADEIIRQGANVRLGLIGFDIGGYSGIERKFKKFDLSTYTIGVWKLTSPEIFKRNIESLELCIFGGGGCYLANDDTKDIFPHVVRAFDGPHKNSRILVIISDEMGNNAALDTIVSQLNENAIRAFVLGVPGRQGAHEQIAKRTKGEFWDIFESKGRKNFSSLLGEVADTIGRETTKTLSDGSIATGTSMGEALKLVSTRLTIPPMSDRAFPPVVVLISDGKPTDNFDEGLSVFMQKPWGRKAVRLAIGIGNEADLSCLQKFIGHNDYKPFRATNPEALLACIRWASTEVVKAASAPPSIDKRALKPGMNVPVPKFDPDDHIEIPKNDVW